MWCNLPKPLFGRCAVGILSQFVVLTIPTGPYPVEEYAAGQMTAELTGAIPLETGDGMANTERSGRSNREHTKTINPPQISGYYSASYISGPVCAEGLTPSAGPGNE
jgi:hypothetical protein